MDEEKIENFCAITGTARNLAIEFLERAGWDYCSAISCYYTKTGPDSPSSVPVHKVASTTASLSSMDLFNHYRKIPRTQSSPSDNSKPSNNSDFVETASSIGVLYKEAAKKNPTGNVGSSNQIAYSSIPQSDDNDITFWSNGFTVGSGPLRSYEDPKNSEFLESIENQETPREFRDPNNLGPMEVNVRNRCEETFVPGIIKVKPFSGKGQRLGSPTDVKILKPEEKPQEIEIASSECPESSLKLDESLPVTLLRIRLIDGTQITLKVNLGHTIEDIKRHLASLKTSCESRDFNLMASFPPTPLDDKLTIEEANLMNSFLVQKLCQ